MLSRFISLIVNAAIKLLGPKRDDPKRTPQPPKTAGPKRDDPK